MPKKSASAALVKIAIENAMHFFPAVSNETKISALQQLIDELSLK